MSTLVRAAVGGALALGLVASEGRAQQAAQPAANSPVYVVYYWRARPGRMAEYSEYIHRIAEPIDEEAHKAGVFEEVRTYTQAITTGAPGADWTHMRVFKLRNFAALDSFAAGIDAATHKLWPEDSKRPRSDDLRDLVRQEIWRDFR